MINSLPHNSISFNAKIRFQQPKSNIEYFEKNICTDALKSTRESIFNVGKGIFNLLGFMFLLKPMTQKILKIRRSIKIPN